MTNLGPYQIFDPANRVGDYISEAKTLLQEGSNARKYIDRLLKQQKITSKEYHQILESVYGILETGHVDVPRDVALEIGRKLNVDFDKVDFDEFRKGISVEMEHSDTVGDGFTMAAKIALDHLEELPDYYSKLETIE